MISIKLFFSYTVRLPVVWTFSLKLLVVVHVGYVAG